jgi:serine/threonine-protein kinase RsbW
MGILRLPARIESLETIRSHIVQGITNLGVPQDVIFKIELVLEELVTNVINYAYPPEEEGEMEVEYSLDTKKRLQLSIKDWGTPFNPLAQEDPELSKNLSERQIGGLGIYLVRQLAGELNYQRQYNENILTMSFQL